MIEAVWQLNAEGQIEAISVHGHALFADPGDDIVCAAVSAVVQTVLAGLEDVIGLQPEVTLAKGRFVCRGTSHAWYDQPSQTLLKTLTAGLQGIAAAHPDELRCRQEEV